MVPDTPTRGPSIRIRRLIEKRRPPRTSGTFACDILRQRQEPGAPLSEHLRSHTKARLYSPRSVRDLTWPRLPNCRDGPDEVIGLGGGCRNCNSTTPIRTMATPRRRVTIASVELTPRQTQGQCNINMIVVNL